MTATYEEALAKHYSKSKIIHLPLVSWDFFGSQNFEINKLNAIQKKWKAKVNFREINELTKREIIITNLNQEIIFASQGMAVMNGYQPFEIIGKSPKLFQGKLTSEKSKNNIRTNCQLISLYLSPIFVIIKFFEIVCGKMFVFFSVISLAEKLL